VTRAPSRPRAPGAAGVARAALLVAVLTGVSRVVGAGRTLVLTNTVPGCVGGTYTVANTLPTIAFEVVAGGALAGVVVPVLAGGVAAGDAERVRRTASALLGWALVGLVPLAALLAALAGPLAGLVLGGDGRCPGSVALAGRLLVVFAPQVVLYGLAVVLTGVLQAHRRFAGPAAAPLLSSAVVGAGYLLYAALGGSGSAAALPPAAELALGAGTTLGAAALVLALVPSLRRLRLGLRPALRFPPGAGARVRRLGLAGVAGLAGQQVTAAVALRLGSDGTPPGTQLVYGAALTVFLLPWAALALPLATSVSPVLAGAAATGDDAGYRRSLAPVAVLVLAGSAVAAGVLAAAAGPLAGVFCASAGAGGSAAALRAALLGLAPGLPGYALVALLTRALWARGRWRAPTACVLAGWLLAVLADLVLARTLPAADRALALAAGHSTGVTAAGLALAVVTARTAGRAALAGAAHAGVPALAAAAAGAAAGLGVLAAVGAGGVPRAGVPATVGLGLLAGAVALGVAAAVLAATARAPLVAAVRALRAPAAGRG
jgi:putative peptidoglycan lipid II flippase